MDPKPTDPDGSDSAGSSTGSFLDLPAVTVNLDSNEDSHQDRSSIVGYRPTESNPDDVAIASEQVTHRAAQSRI